MTFLKKHYYCDTISYMMMMILRMTTNDYDPHDGTDDYADSDGDVILFAMLEMCW